MNIFQQVFASVDPKASQLVKASENVNDNIVAKKEKEITISDNQPKAKKVVKKEKQIKTSYSKDLPQTYKIDFKPSLNQAQNGIKASNSTIPVSTTIRKVPKSKDQPIDQIKKNQQAQDSSNESSFNKDEILSQISQLEQRYLELSEQLNKVNTSFNKSQVHNEKLISQNFELEMDIQKLKETTRDSNNRLLEMKQDYDEKSKERDESWEFKINELMMELEVLTDSCK